MAENTTRLDLLKKNPVTDGLDTFNIETMLNENWQKIDDNVALVDANGKVVNKDGTPAGGVNPDYLSHTGYAATTGTANAYIATLTPALSAYREGVSLRLKINVENTGTSTVNVNGLGAKQIKKANGENVKSGDLKAGSIYTLVYNGVNFQSQGEGGDFTTQQRADFVTTVNKLLLM